jgi:D-amino-acid dehydrogenase
LSKNFSVLGAGIVGVCTALALQREGWSVTLIDRDEPGRGCSFGNAGIIHTGGCVPLARPGIVGAVPGMLLDPEGPLVIRWRHLPRLLPWLARMAAASRRGRVEASSRALAPLALAARAAYQPLLKEAEAEDLMRARGELYVYRERASFEAASWEMDVRRRFGVPVEELDAQSLKDIEPALSPDYRHAHYQPDSAFTVNPFRLVQSLATLFVAKGGTILRKDVRHAKPDGSGGAVLFTGEKEMTAENLVICAGAFSRPFAASLGAEVPLETWRGYHIMVAGGPRINGVIVDGDVHFAVTPMEDGIRVAGLIELASLDAPPNYARADLFLKLARKLIPAFPTEATSRWMGHRPGMPDTVPVIGRSPAQRNVWFNFGHGMLGLTFGPITAQLLAGMAAGRTSAIDPAPYRAERFLSPWRL